MHTEEIIAAAERDVHGDQVLEVADLLHGLADAFEGESLSRHAALRLQLLLQLGVERAVRRALAIEPAHQADRAAASRVAVALGAAARRNRAPLVVVALALD